MRHLHRGFNLVELAVVMAVIGVIMGGVWVTVNRVNENVRVDQASTQLFSLMKTVRSHYMGQASIPNSDLTDTLAAANMVPKEMIRVGSSPRVLDHPWGPTRPNGTALATGGVSIAGSASYFFTLTWRGLKTASCIAFMTRNTAGAGAEGLTSATINGTAVSALPVTVSQATSLCGSTGTAGADIVLTYRLRLAS